MAKDMGMDNMAGSIPKDPDPSHDYRQPVNPDAKGAAMGAPVFTQKAQFTKSSVKDTEYGSESKGTEY